MIGKVTGRVGYVAADHALIEAAGVGYVVHCAPRTLAQLPAPGAPAALYTEMTVREDSMTLFGFSTLVEKEWHRLLTSVQGVGAKASLAILDALGADGVSRAIALGDAAAIRRAQGVGPKLAQRVALELKDKAPDVMALGALAARAAPVGAAVEVAASAEEASPAAEGPADPPTEEPGPAGPRAEADALSALVNLGYPAHEAAGAVAQAARAAEGGEGADAAALIKAALKGLAGRL